MYFTGSREISLLLQDIGFSLLGIYELQKMRSFKTCLPEKHESRAVLTKFYLCFTHMALKDRIMLQENFQSKDTNDKERAVNIFSTGFIDAILIH